MDESDLLYPDVIDLVVQLCTRIGMMMEDVSPLALAASSEGLEVEERVAVIASATRKMVAIAASAEALIER